MKLWAAAVLAACFALYLHTMSPSVSVGDSGEFIAASGALALPHAPSYPLFTLLGKCAVTVEPFGNLAYRVNLATVLFGALTAASFLLLAWRTGLSPAPAALAALMLAFSGSLWEHSLGTEVFSLNGLFAVWVLLASLGMGRREPPPRRAALAGFLLGLGLGNHHTLILAAPAALAVFFLESGERGDGPAAASLMGTAAAFFTLGLSIYIFLPVRSALDPPLDWSNPENLKNFIRVLTRADYGTVSLALGEKLPRDLGSAWGQVWRYLSGVGGEWTWAGLAAAVLGWAAWLRRAPRAALPFLVLFLSAGPGFLILGNLPFDAQSNGILPRFFLLPAIPMALAVGHFFQSFASARPRWVLWAGVLLPAAVLWRGYGDKVFFRREFAALDYGKNLLRTLPEGSVLFMDGGDDTFYTLAYLTMAEKRRPDLELHDRGGLIYPNPYGDDFRMIPRDAKEARRQAVESSFLGLRPLYYSTFNRGVLQGARLVQRGILYRAERPGSPPPAGPDPYWHVYSYRGLYGSPPRPYRLRALLPLYPFLRGLETGDLGHFRRAAGYGADIPWLKANLAWEASARAYPLVQKGDLEGARALYLFALSVDPGSADALTNLGVLAEKESDLAAAESYYLRSIRIDPGHADAYYNLGVVYWRSGRWRDVARLFEKTLELKPDHPTAGRFLAQARRRLAEGGAR